MIQVIISYKRDQCPRSPSPVHGLPIHREGYRIRGKVMVRVRVMIRA